MISIHEFKKKTVMIRVCDSSEVCSCMQEPKSMNTYQHTTSWHVKGVKCNSHTKHYLTFQLFSVPFMKSIPSFCLPPISNT